MQWSLVGRKKNENWYISNSSDCGGLFKEEAPLFLILFHDGPWERIFSCKLENSFWMMFFCCFGKLAQCGSKIKYQTMTWKIFFKPKLKSVDTYEINKMLICEDKKRIIICMIKLWAIIFDIILTYVYIHMKRWWQIWSKSLDSRHLSLFEEWKKERRESENWSQVNVLIERLSA